jgi:SAM-dependent methyltransferase
LEVETNAATALRERLGAANVRVVLGDGARMPFEDGSFSAVVAFTMLHHVPTPALQDQMLAEARRVLRPGGVFAGFDGVGSLAFRLIHLGDTYTPVEPETFGQRLEAAGFADVCVERGRSRFRFRARAA